MDELLKVLACFVCAYKDDCESDNTDMDDCYLY